jgi:DNA invertase Pin-like site-specific DNA recombinase
MRAGLYCRVSTTDQKNAIQIAELTAYAKARNWEVTEIHQDQMSGAKATRPGLAAILKSARARRIDVVLVMKLDRFGRSSRDLHNNIAELDALGVRFIATTQGIDTDQSNPVSRFVMTILGAVAELERDFIRERVAAGMKHAAVKGTRSGKAIGRPRALFSRTKAVELRQGGMSIREIAAELGVSHTSVARVCSKTNLR